MTDTQIIIALYPVFFVIWYGLYRYMKWVFREEIKELEHAHKMQSSTYLEPERIPQIDLDIFTCEPTFEEYRAGCN